MKLLDAQASLLAMGQPVFSTSDAAARLRITRENASKALSRLLEAGSVCRLTRGRWALTGKVDRLALAAPLAAPHPSYLSLQTALFHHGMIEQVPDVIYSVTTGKTRRHRTPLGTYSYHHLHAGMVFGFEPAGPLAIPMATPEKALIDLLYLAPARSRLFSALPELEFPRGFSLARARVLATRVPHAARRSLVEESLRRLWRGRD